MVKSSVVSDVESTASLSISDFIYTFLMRVSLKKNGLAY